MKNVAIFASGSGTNAENIVRYFSKSETIKVAVVLSNNRNVGVHARVNKLGVPSFVFSREEFADGAPVLAKLAEYDTDLIVLAGFMNKISDPLLNAYPGKIINIHPALLPKYGGKGMYGIHVHKAVVAAGERETGITIHYIDEHYDEGTVIFQMPRPAVRYAGRGCREGARTRIRSLSQGYRRFACSPYLRDCIRSSRSVA